MTKKYAFKKGFTLAEVMIVLTVIGVLTAILLPVARQSMPDENLMKFKKAHNTLGAVIRELVTSDKYYRDGDLGIKPSGDLVDGTHEGDFSYFCETIAEVVNHKDKDCSIDDKYTGASAATQGPYQEAQCADVVAYWADRKARLDVNCKAYPNKKFQSIVLQDGVVIYELNGITPFGITNGAEFSKEADCIANYGESVCNSTQRYFSGSQTPPTHYDCNGFDRIYKRICVDIDGVPENATADDCVNECPFGYGIRADGKILTGARADEWLEREVNEE